MKNGIDKTVHHENGDGKRYYFVRSGNGLVAIHAKYSGLAGGEEDRGDEVVGYADQLQAEIDLLPRNKKREYLIEQVNRLRGAVDQLTKPGIREKWLESQKAELLERRRKIFGPLRRQRGRLSTLPEYD